MYTTQTGNKPFNSSSTGYNMQAVPQLHSVSGLSHFTSLPSASSSHSNSMVNQSPQEVSHKIKGWISEFAMEQKRMILEDAQMQQRFFTKIKAIFKDRYKIDIDQYNEVLDQVSMKKNVLTHSLIEVINDTISYKNAEALFFEPYCFAAWNAPDLFSLDRSIKASFKTDYIKYVEDGTMYRMVDSFIVPEALRKLTELNLKLGQQWEQLSDKERQISKLMQAQEKLTQDLNTSKTEYEQARETTRLFRNELDERQNAFIEVNEKLQGELDKKQRALFDLQEKLQIELDQRDEQKECLYKFEAQITAIQTLADQLNHLLEELVSAEAATPQTNNDEKPENKITTDEEEQTLNTLSVDETPKEKSQSEYLSASLFNVTMLQDCLERSKAKIESLKRVLNNKDSLLSRYQGALSSNEQSIRSLNDKIEDYWSEMEVYESEQHQMQLICAQQVERIRTLEMQLGKQPSVASDSAEPGPETTVIEVDAEQEIDSLNNEALVSLIETQCRKIAALDRDLCSQTEAARKNILTAETDIVTLTEQVERLQENCGLLESDVCSATLKSDALTEEVRTLREALLIRQHEKEAMQAQLEALSVENENLTLERDDLKDQNKKLSDKTAVSSTVSTSKQDTSPPKALEGDDLKFFNKHHHEKKGARNKHSNVQQGSSNRSQKQPEY